MRNGRRRDCVEPEDAIRLGLVDSAEGLCRILLMALPSEAPSLPHHRNRMRPDRAT